MNTNAIIETALKTLAVAIAWNEKHYGCGVKYVYGAWEVLNVNGYWRVTHNHNFLRGRFGGRRAFHTVVAAKKAAERSILARMLEDARPR